MLFAPRPNDLLSTSTTIRYAPVYTHTHYITHTYHEVSTQRSPLFHAAQYSMYVKWCDSDVGRIHQTLADLLGWRLSAKEPEERTLEHANTNHITHISLSLLYFHRCTSHIYQLVRKSCCKMTMRALWNCRSNDWEKPLMCPPFCTL